jgi:predicted acyltransferase
MLSTFPAIGTCLFGVFAGLLMRDARISAEQKTLWLITGGCALLAAGYLWALQFPIIKAIWTSSFVLVTAAKWW